MTNSKGLTCFVIMPFGEKPDTDGKLINFDVVYRYIIAAAVNGLKDTDQIDIDCVRCDDIEEAGSIRTDMFTSILKADIAIVDITSLNPNVFYELGIRHALKECLTILIRRKVSVLPFNIQGLRAIDYDPADIDSFDTAMQEIQTYIRNGLKSKRTDSPVHEVLPELKITSPAAPLHSGDRFEANLIEQPDKVVGLVTGDIKRLYGIADVWVNSENTHMQMARYYDRSISGLIRYLGSERDNGQVKKDLIGDALEKALRRGKAVKTVDPATVVATDAGTLATDSHKVKRIFHVAAVRGVPGRGYEPVPNIDDCVWSALERADKENEEHEQDADGTFLRSLLFPVFGTGTARAGFRENIEVMMRATISYFEEHTGRLERVYFLTYDQGQLTAGQDVMNALAREERITVPVQAPPLVKED